MGVALSEICDCEKKDTRNEVNDVKLQKNNSEYLNPYIENNNSIKEKKKASISTIDNSKLLANDLLITQDILSGRLSDKYKVKEVIKIHGRNKESTINLSPKNYDSFSNTEKNNNNIFFATTSNVFSSNNSISSKLKKMLKRNEKSKIYR